MRRIVPAPARCRAARLESSGAPLSLAFAAADWKDPDAGRPSLILLGALLLASLGWYQLVLKRRPGGWAPRLERDTHDP